MGRSRSAYTGERDSKFFSKKKKYIFITLKEEKETNFKFKRIRENNKNDPESA